MLTHIFLLFIAIRLANSQLGRNFDMHNDPSVTKFGDVTRNDYFRLLEVDGKFLIVGAANKFFNLTIDGLKNISVEYDWPPGLNELKDCGMKTSDEEEDCKNYIRVLTRDDRNGNLLVCGTNAYKPLCRVLKRKSEKFSEMDPYETVLEFSGTGLSPLDPKHNSTFYREDDFLYAATVADFSGTDSLVFRRNISRIEDKGIRTIRDDIKFLNKPQFAGSLSTSNYVYFFFREEAIEVDEREGPTVYSRVARVCKNDQGGPRLFNKEWTTFVKARLNCSLPGNKQFYFDQIVSISNPTHRHANNENEGGVVYATFVSEYDFLSHSVICAFDIEDIDRLFAISPYYTKDKNRNVYLRKRRDEASRKLGQCHNHSDQLTEDEAIMLRSHPLMVDSIPSVFGRAVGVYQGDDHYNQIAVLEKVPINRNETQGVDVMYVGTDRGNIIKMVNLNGKKTDGKEDSILKVATYKVSNLPIRRLLIKDDRLIAVTDRVVYGLPLHFCSKYQSCHECISSRDPHCAWNLQENRCVFNDKLNSKKSVLYQDVNHGNTSACPSLKVEEIIPVVEKVAPAETITRKPEDFRANELEEIEECDCDENEKTKSKKDLRHSAICDCSKTKDVKKAENGLFGQTSPVVSSEKDEETSKFWPWIIMLVVIQAAIIIGLVAAVWMYRNRYVKRSKLSTSIHTQSTVINAYETPLPINVGTLRHSESLRSPTRPMISKTYSAGDIDIHTRLEGSSTIIPIYAHTHAQTP